MVNRYDAGVGDAESTCKRSKLEGARFNEVQCRSIDEPFIVRRGYQIDLRSEQHNVEKWHRWCVCSKCDGVWIFYREYFHMKVHADRFAKNKFKELIAEKKFTDVFVGVEPAVPELWGAGSDD